MIWLLLVLFGGLIVWGIILLKDDDDNFGGTFALAFGVVLSITIIIALPSVHVSNGVGLAEMKMFQDANQANYAITVDETASYLSQQQFIDSVLVEGSIEKLQQAGYVSERIKEWRDAVNQYNTTLASMKYYNSNIWFGVLVPNEVDELKPIIIKP